LKAMSDIYDHVFISSFLLFYPVQSID
jgi:hypothetical protein